MEEDRGAPNQRISFLISCLPILILTLCVKSTEAVACGDRMDIAIAVDTTSSQTSGSFDNVKAEVKSIVSGFSVGQSKTRLALIGMSKQAQVVVNFDGVNSLSDFNAAVDKLTFSTDTVDLSEGLKVAKDSVFLAAGAKKILILVKDRRVVGAPVSDSSVLSRVSSQAAAVKALSAAIHAIGIGGLWNRKELESLFGTEYLLYKDKNKAAESIKSLTKVPCPECTGKGTPTQQAGRCFHFMKHVITTEVAMKTNSAGSTVCQTEIKRDFVACNEKASSCSAMARQMGSCASDGKVTIVDSWEVFSNSLQACIDAKVTSQVTCGLENECASQVADVIFIVDKSGSIEDNFPKVKRATGRIADSLNIRKDKVHVGLILFGTNPDSIITLGSIYEKAQVMQKINDLPDKVDPAAATYTNKAMLMAREAIVKHGRQDVNKFVFVITDGDSSSPTRTFTETAALKNAGVTIYVVGVGKIALSELEMMAAPSPETNLFVLTDFDKLDAWAKSFSKKICLHMSDPHPKLCEEASFHRTVSECTKEKQQVTQSDYKFNAERRCIKMISTAVNNNCRQKCACPVTSNEYLVGENWKALCHEFECKADSGQPKVHVSSAKCLAFDGTCKEPGSAQFKCRDSQGAEKSNCQCLLRDGKASLLIESS